jgi:hypothetical protein
MMQGRSTALWRDALFCTVVSVLAPSYLPFWALWALEGSAQLNRQLHETAQSILADFVAEPTSQGMNRMDRWFYLRRSLGDGPGERLERAKHI